MPMLLADIENGIMCKIERIADQDVFLKLLDMGCIPGEEVSIIYRAPLGDPIAIKVSGYTLSVRLDEARKIEVKKV